MNSSTFSFKTLIKIAMCVFLILLTAELGVRFVVLPRSASFKTIKNARHSATTSGDDTRNDIAVLGNSFTINGIDTALLENEAAKNEAKLAVHAMSGSALCEWYWLAELNLLNAESAPDFVVLNAGPRALVDRDDIKHRRLALIFGSDRTPLVPWGDVSPKKQFEFLLSRYSMLINRGRNVGTIVSTKLLPNHQASIRLLKEREETEPQKNITTESELAPESSASAKKPESITIFQRLQTKCKERNSKLIIVLMPHRSFYELPAEVDLYIQDESMTLLDLRQPEGILAEHFADEVHLNPQGKKIFSPVYCDVILRAIDQDN